MNFSDVEPNKVRFLTYLLKTTMINSIKKQKSEIVTHPRKRCRLKKQATSDIKKAIKQK